MDAQRGRGGWCCRFQYSISFWWMSIFSVWWQWQASPVRDTGGGGWEADGDAKRLHSSHNFPFPVSDPCGTDADNGPSRGSTQDTPAVAIRFDAFDPSILISWWGCVYAAVYLCVNGCLSIIRSKVYPCIYDRRVRHPRQANSRLSCGQSPSTDNATQKPFMLLYIDLTLASLMKIDLLKAKIRRL